MMTSSIVAHAVDWIVRSWKLLLGETSLTVHIKKIMVHNYIRTID
jgi:hypothetical protein